MIELICRLARENPRRAYQRIAGELAGLGVQVSPTTVAKVLRSHRIHPAPKRQAMSWREFLRAQAAGVPGPGVHTRDIQGPSRRGRWGTSRPKTLHAWV